MARKPANRSVVPQAVEEAPISEELKISTKEVCDKLGIKLRILREDATEVIGRQYGPKAVGPYRPEIYGANLDHDRFGVLCNKTLEPDDLQYLLELYRAGKLPFRKRPKTFEVPAEIQAYADTPRTTLVEKSRALEAEKATASAAAADARRQKLENLGAVREEEFTYPFLNELFFHHKVKEGSLTVSGIAVSKSLQPYRSNSGKNKDWQVTFTWIGSDGKPRVVEKSSLYAGNRRNDAERNWGLPE
jgi:hypothetical protein